MTSSATDRTSDSRGTVAPADEDSFRKSVSTVEEVGDSGASDTRQRYGAGDRSPVSPGEEGGSFSQSELERCERTIRQHQRHEIEVSRAARQIIDDDLYRESGFEDLGTYSRETFGFGKKRLYQLSYHAEVYDVIEENRAEIAERCSTNVEGVPLPTTRAWARPLHSLANRGQTDLLLEIWAKVIERYGSSITGARVRELFKEIDGEGTEGEQKTQVQPPDPDTPSDGGKEESETRGSRSEGQPDSRDEETDHLEQARSEFAPLLNGLNDGVSRSLLAIADTLADEGPTGKDHLEVARASFESLSHREDSVDEGSSSLPGCITGKFDTISNRDILVAYPTDLLTPRMARKAVPVGVPQLVSVVGLPLSHFDGQPPVGEIHCYYEEQDRDFSFNETTENVDWAGYTINPVTGCLHTCGYCYARHQAEQLSRYKQGFQPTFFPGRLMAFSEMEPPEEVAHPREKNVFVGSMSDVFGKWVPEWMIQAILDEVEENEGFDYLFLTKFPQKLSRFRFPDNAWVGTTVDKKHRVALAERHFREVDARVKWLSCEPLLENVAPEFDDLSMFDCVVIGAQKAYGKDIAENQPEFDWVIELYQKARKAGCSVYFKENLDVFPKELPEGSTAA